jgi:hypothetical protein
MTKAWTIRDTPRSESEPLSAAPMPLSSRTPPSMPPAPVMRMMEQTGPSALSTISLTSAMEEVHGRPRTAIATMTMIISATGVLPSRPRKSAQPSPLVDDVGGDERVEDRVEDRVERDQHQRYEEEHQDGGGPLVYSSLLLTPAPPATFPRLSRVSPKISPARPLRCGRPRGR